ncbi:DUF2867 domain-containing protein [Rhodopseudomonas boonkerdii]|uniref:DUF2867 domain-containing protein n=1 Tax=Rhodopseudomonas boonkerdii TaxID=475937 RepID=UPI001E356B81|nr:DUF2867 domain-containing protein [Rhodopseudomonas boonkerdii]UGV24233.1 DUF2867 domain-containing protein [Rhodopseudomonas boonkerdii]
MVSAVQPTADIDAFLAGAQFADAFCITTATTLSAREAAERMLSRSPWWVDALMKLRDAIVTPLGLKTAKSARNEKVEKVGFFPLLSETPQRLVAGFNDSHLDFRVVIDVASLEAGQRVTATTIVLTHNWIGRTYLTIITPFHRMVVRSMLKQVQQKP